MKALEHYNTGMTFAPNRQSSKIKLRPRSSSRIETGFSKDKMTAKVYKSFQALGFIICATGPHNITIIKGGEYIGLQVEAKKWLSSGWLSNWSSFNVDAKSLATMFNDHFVSGASSASNPTPSELPCATPAHTCQLPPLSLQLTQPKGCEIKLSKLQPCNSTGLVGIPSSMLKIASPVITIPVCSIVMVLT